MVTTRSRAYDAPSVDKSARVSKPSTAKLQKEVDQLKTKLADKSNPRMLKEQIEDLTIKLHEKEEELDHIKASHQDAFQAVGVEQARLNKVIHMKDMDVELLRATLIRDDRKRKRREAVLLQEIDGLKKELVHLNQLVQSSGSTPWSYTFTSETTSAFRTFLSSDEVGEEMDKGLEAWHDDMMDVDALLDELRAKFTVPWLDHHAER